MGRVLRKPRPILLERNCVGMYSLSLPLPHASLFPLVPALLPFLLRLIGSLIWRPIPLCTGGLGLPVQQLDMSFYLSLIISA